MGLDLKAQRAQEVRTDWIEHLKAQPAQEVRTDWTEPKEFMARDSTNVYSWDLDTNRTILGKLEIFNTTFSLGYF